MPNDTPQTTLRPLPPPDLPQHLRDALGMLERRTQDEARKMQREGFSWGEAYRRARILTDHARHPLENAAVRWIEAQPVRAIVEMSHG
jgi:hypothetical protein